MTATKPRPPPRMTGVRWEERALGTSTMPARREQRPRGKARRERRGEDAEREHDEAGAAHRPPDRDGTARAARTARGVTAGGIAGGRGQDAGPGARGGRGAGGCAALDDAGGGPVGEPRGAGPGCDFAVDGVDLAAGGAFLGRLEARAVERPQGLQGHVLKPLVRLGWVVSRHEASDQHVPTVRRGLVSDPAHCTPPISPERTL